MSADTSTKHGMLTDEQWTVPTRLATAWRTCKVIALRGLRFVQNIRSGPRRIARSSSMVEAPVRAEHRSPLWVDGRADEFLLRCGKVQNLRIAIQGFDGVEVKAGQTVSFWSQVGRPSASRGFVIGREIINGCVVPTIGGGLCQLSNALATLALASNAQLVERHRHTALIQEQETRDEDATVAWNYVDLRFKAEFDFRIEAELTSEELVVRIRTANPLNVAVVSHDSRSNILDDRPTARGCLTCDQTSCFRHRPYHMTTSGSTAVLVNDRHPELERWLRNFETPGDWMVPWVRPRLRSRSWTPPSESNVTIAFWPGVKRAARQRLLRGEGASRQALRMQTASDLARHYARRLREDHTDLVVTQELAVPLLRLGVLGGRTFHVYVPELPASELQARLDAAAVGSPTEASLQDFRVDEAWQRDEWRALSMARTLLTPHHQVHNVLQASGLNVELLPWVEQSMPSSTRNALSHQLTIAFASSALARKGAHEVATVARELGARVLILGSPPTNEVDWNGVEWLATGYGGDWLAASDVVVLPAYVEHQPRALLQAISSGVPVVATAACGLGTRKGVVEIPPGNAAALRQAILLCVADSGNSSSASNSQRMSTVGDLSF